MFFFFYFYQYICCFCDVVMYYASKIYSQIFVNFLHFQQQELSQLINKKIIFLIYFPPILESIGYVDMEFHCAIV